MEEVFKLFMLFGPKVASAQSGSHTILYSALAYKLISLPKVAG